MAGRNNNSPMLVSEPYVMCDRYSFVSYVMLGQMDNGRTAPFYLKVSTKGDKATAKHEPSHWCPTPPVFSILRWTETPGRKALADKLIAALPPEEHARLTRKRIMKQ